MTLENRLDYGDVIGGVLENGFRAFAGGTPEELQIQRYTKQGFLEKLLFTSGFTDPARKDSWTVGMLSHFGLGFSVLGILSCELIQLPMITFLLISIV